MRTIRIILAVISFILFLLILIFMDFDDLSWSANRSNYLGLFACILNIWALLFIIKDKDWFLHPDRWSTDLLVLMFLSNFLNILKS
jgi:uncharacterized membrane protein